MTEQWVLQARLEEAEEAYHRLMTGASVVTVDVGTYGRTTYTPADAKALSLYIASLKQQVGHHQPITNIQFRT